MRIVDIRALPLRFDRGDMFGGRGRSGGAPPSVYFRQQGWRGLYAEHIETLLVRIETDTGLIGFGESQSPVAPQATATIVDSILRPMLLDRNPMAGDVLRHEMYGAMNIRGHFTGFMLDAIAGVDSALWDLRGKALGVPAHVLFGGPFRQRLPAYVSGIRGDNDGDRIENVRTGLAQGFKTFKYCGGFGIERDLETMRALRAALGPEVQFAVDNLWAYDINEALKLGRALEGLGVLWYEAPTDPEDLDGNVELARALDIPIANGETERTRYQLLPWFQRRALDIVQPDVGRGGMTETRKIADLAETFHIPVALHMGVSSAPLIAASLQVGAAIPNLIFVEYQPVMLEMANRVLRRPLICEAGEFVLPEGPGLGIEIDEAALTPFIVTGG